MGVFGFAAVGSDQLLDNAVTTPKINALAVTTAKIANLNVTTPKIAVGVIAPIGSIMEWSMNFPNTPALPDGWILRDGVIINDAGSPYNGQTPNNLNQLATIWDGIVTDNNGGNQDSSKDGMRILVGEWSLVLTSVTKNAGAGGTSCRILDSAFNEITSANWAANVAAFNQALSANTVYYICNWFAGADYAHIKYFGFPNYLTDTKPYKVTGGKLGAAATSDTQFLDIAGITVTYSRYIMRIK